MAARRRGAVSGIFIVAYRVDIYAGSGWTRRSPQKAGRFHGDDRGTGEGGSEQPSSVRLFRKKLSMQLSRKNPQPGALFLCVRIQWIPMDPWMYFEWLFSISLPHLFLSEHTSPLLLSPRSEANSVLIIVHCFFPLCRGERTTHVLANAIHLGRRIVGA